MFGLIKKVFLGLLFNMVNASNYTKCVSLSNQDSMQDSTYSYQFRFSWIYSRIKLLSIYSYFFFLSGFSFTKIHKSQDTGLQGKGEGVSLTLHYHFHTIHRHLDISLAITAESSPLHIASSRSRIGAQVANH